MSAARAGRLRHRIEIQRNDYTQDPNTGEQVRDWKQVKTIWASVEPISGKDFIAAGAEQSEVRNRITVRWNDWITPDMRIKFRGMYYHIQAIMADNRSGLEHLTIMATQGVRREQDL